MCTLKKKSLPLWFFILFKEWSHCCILLPRRWKGVACGSAVEPTSATTETTSSAAPKRPVGSRGSPTTPPPSRWSSNTVETCATSPTTTPTATPLWRYGELVVIHTDILLYIAYHYPYSYTTLKVRRARSNTTIHRLPLPIQLHHFEGTESSF